MNILLLSIKGNKKFDWTIITWPFVVFLKKKSDSHLYNPGNKKMTLNILQKPVHNVHFELKSQSKCRFITVLDWKWNLDTCEDTTQQGILRWGMLLTTWLLSDPCPMIQSTQSSFITLDNFYPPSLTLYIPY